MEYDSSTTKGNTDLFKRSPTQPDDSYGETYLAARPKYHLSGFYDLIMNYHREHGNASFDTAHDIACGPAQVAEELAKHFKQVVASDANAAHLEVALTRLARHKNISFVVCPSEEVRWLVEPASVDMICVAEAMPLMDMPSSLDTFYGILRSGGTLAMWFYGCPHFLANDGATLDNAVNEAYSKLGDHLFAPIHAANKEMFQQPMHHMHSWFDDVEIPANHFKDVQRMKWNFDCEMPFASPTSGGLDGLMPDSRVGAHEECTSTMDRSFWGGKWTLEDAKKFLSVNLPVFDPAKFESEEYMRLCAALENAMGGKDVERQVTWPVILILATK